MLRKLPISPLDVLLVFVPISVGLELFHASKVWIFACACLAIIPLAGWMGKATEHLAGHFGPGVGGLLNASFGNAAELIIAIMALREGLHGIVKASLTGSIIGNVLLVLGLSLLLGGARHQRQKFNKTAAGLGSTQLALCAIGLLVPAIFHMVAPEPGRELTMSLAISVVLFVTYGLSLLFTLITHKHLFAAGDEHVPGPLWTRTRSMIVLVVATALVGVMAEFLVGAVDETSKAWGLTEVFVGVVLVAIIGNAAEHSTAILMAMKNKMDLAINIAVGSGIQIALFVAPVLVFLSYAISDRPMDLVFTSMEVIAVTMAVAVVAIVADDGESHWMEGILLLAVYVILGIAFFYMPG